MKKATRYALWISVLLLPLGLLVWILVAMVGGWVTARRSLP